MQLSASGRSWAIATPHTDATAAGEAAFERGGNAVDAALAAAVAGWKALHRVGAELPWAGAFDRATSLASDGAVVSRSLHRVLTASDAPHAADPGLRRIFYPGGSPLALGSRFASPQLARTLAVLASQGAPAMYGGEVGRAYVEGLRERGSALTIDDLAAHEASLPQPLEAAFRDLRVSVVPPTSQGFVLLEMLAAIDRLGLDPDPHGSDAGTIARV